MTTGQPINLGLCMHLRVTAFPLADANGNCVTYSDNAGNVQAHYVYDALGGTVSSGDMDDDFSFRFSSKYLDDETGLNCYGFRYYAPVLGRWLSRDPIEEEGGKNLYEFVNNDAVGRWDLLGLYMHGPRNIRFAWDCQCELGETIGVHQDPSYTLVEDGCTRSPDTYIYPSVFGIQLINLKPSCIAHDYCYQKCGASRKDCDKEFLSDLRQACKDHCRNNPMMCYLDAGFLSSCYVNAEIYYLAVRGAGNLDTFWGFDNFQEKACEPCCCNLIPWEGSL